MLAPQSSLIICYAVPNEADARALSASIKNRGYGAGYFWIPDYEPEGKKLFRVYAGPYRNKESALAGLVELKKIFRDAYYYQLK